MKLTLSSILVGLLLLTVSACSGQPPLSGTLQLDDEAWQPTVYLIAPISWKNAGSSYVGTLLDSAAVDENGYFAFAGLPAAAEPTLWQLAVQRKGERFLNRLDNENPAASNYMPILWRDGAQLHVRASISHFQASFEIEQPNTDQQALLALRDVRQQSFTKHLGAPDTARGHSENLLAEEEALLAFQEELLRFADSTKQVLPALMAIRWASIAGNYERFPELIVAQAERWQHEAPHHPWVQELQQVGDRSKLPVLIGDRIPNYAMPLLEGDTSVLLNLLGPRLTLLDLWASWCGPCRVQNRKYLLPLWQNYHQQGFQIVAYGLEASDRSWKRAIEQDDIQHWPHASDLMGDDSPFFEQLRISTIPANYLLDAEGKVLAKNLHGDELVEFVRSYLAE